MNPLPPFLDVLMYISSAIAALIGVQRWTVRRKRPVASTGALLGWAASLWLLTSALTLSSSDLESKVFWQRLQFVAIFPVPLLWFYLAMQFTGLDRRLTGRWVLLLCVPPAVMLVLLLTDPLHHLILARAWMIDRGPFQQIETTYGPAVWAYFIYGYLQVFTGTAILGWMIIRRPGFRWQGTTLLLAVILTATANTVDILNLWPDLGFRLTPLSLLVCIPVSVLTLVPFSRLDIVPVARGTVIETMRDGLLVLDTDSQILDLNPAAARIFGTTLARVKGKRLAEMWPAWPEDAGKLSARSRPTEVVRFQQGDQSQAYEVTSSRLRDWRGQVVGQVLVLREVTARKQAEQALRESEERFRSVFENTLVGVYQVAPDGRILFANRALGQMLGLDSPGEMQRGHPNGASVLLTGRLGQGIQEADEIRGRVLTWKKPTGGVIRIRQNARAVRDSKGAIRYYEGTVEDVTELVDARDELQRRARYLQALNSVIAAGAAPMDAPGMMEACLDSTLKALGLPAGGVWADRHERFVGMSHDIRDVLEGLGSVFDKTIEVEDGLQIPSGSPLQGLARAMPFSGIGSVLAFPIIADGSRIGGFVLGATQSRPWRQEEVALGEAVASEVAAGLHRIHMVEQAGHQERLAAVGQLAAGIAHDFNNILGAIVLHTEMLARETGLSPRGVARTATILEQGRRATSLVSQVLDFSRRSVLEMQPMDLRTFVKGQIKLLERTLPETIRPVLLAEDGEYFMRGDLTRIQQVLLNLSTNARDAMPGGGTLTFSLRRTTLSPQDHRPFPGMPGGDWLVLEVKDTGTGMSDEVKSHLFEPFFTTKAPGKGTGLGLSQVYGIIKQHEGYIDVSSAEGTGTTFTMFFPALPTSIPQAEEPTSDAEKGEGETLLLVEDESSTREAMTEVLEGLGYTVVCASNGRHALELFEQNAHRIRLVISDLVMPELGGEGLCVELLRRRPCLKMILVSGYPIGATGQLRETHGIVRLQKPLGMQALAAAVRTALEGDVDPSLSAA